LTEEMTWPATLSSEDSIEPIGPVAELRLSNEPS
jgi:hypothetical protein